MKKIVANRIKKIIGERKITQEELSKILKANRATVSYWVHGTRIIRVDYLRKFCKEMDVSADYVIGLINTPTPLSEIRKEEASK